MEKIIIKKDRVRNQIGFFKPLFVEKGKKIFVAKVEDFPNDGEIYMPKGIDKFDFTNLFYVDKEDLVSNYKYDEQLVAFKENSGAQNPCKFVIYENRVKKVLPTDIIPIYSNKFLLKTRRLLEYDDIVSEVFFLEDNDFIYGPFKKNYLELSVFNFASYEDEFEDSEQYLDFLELYDEYDGEFISKIKKEDVINFLIKDVEGNSYLVDFKSIVSKEIGEYLLFCDDTKLLNWGKERIAKQKPELKSIIDSIDITSQIVGNTTDKHKWQRFKELLQNNEIDEETISDIKYILSEKSLLTFDDQELKKENEDLLIRLQDKDDKIIELTNQIEDQKLDQQHTDQSKSNITDFEEYPFVKEAIKNPKILEENLKTRDDNNRLLARKELLEEDIVKLRKSEAEIKASVQDIIKGFERSASEHTSKLAEAKIYTDLLNGINVDISQASNEDQNDFVPVIREVTKGISAKEYIQEIRERLKILGRDLSFNDVANLIITVNQSFLTILAGAPGIGKTSMADKFAKSLGLSEQFGYLEIHCAKGWNSSKDLIGFYNPLTKDFQESKTKLRTALKASSKYRNAPFIVLLDEANLSPMEHYWSDFIKVSDFDYGRKIKISDKEIIEFGNGFRFLATINHDHTTEMLSNRLLDRTSIIQIEKPDKLNIENKKLVTDQVHSEIFNFSSVDSLFKDTSKWTTENRTLINKLDETIKILESNHSGLIISPRKRNSVINYLRVATGLLDGNNDYIALDYAISQQIMPLVNIRGENHLDSLKNLKELFQKVGMEKSVGLLSRIIERGKEFRHFKYIYY